MANAVYILVLLCTIAISICQGQYVPLVSLYSNIGCSGSYVNLPTRHIPDLSEYGFDNRAYSVRLTGTWLFYENTRFNPRGTGYMEYIFQSKNTCLDFDGLGGYISSVKFAGSVSDFRVDSITFYEYTFFQDREEYVTYDVPSLGLAGYQESLIITGISAWTFYDRPYYSGNSICIKPNSSPYYEPLIIPDLEKNSPRIPYGFMASVRKGCFSANVVTINATSASTILSNLGKL